MTGSARHAPTWSADFYALIAAPGSGRFGDVLALCTIHDEPHIRYVTNGGESWCQSLEPHDRRYRYRRPRAEPERTVRVEIVNVSELGDEIGRARRERSSEREGRSR